jgi:Bacterial Type VI secretion, VC_A0110, EvfL, ImpJ, VasE
MFNLDELQHYPVNWKDGMRVSSKDFAATDKAWADALRDVRATVFQGINFGLLPPLRDSSDTSAYPKLRLDLSPAHSVLTLLECRAITEGGYRIEITEDIHHRLKLPLKLPAAIVQNKESFDVYITIDMFDVQDAGKLSQDAPPRYTHAAPLYELTVQPAGIACGGFNHLKIAEYQYKLGRFERNELYIPPCLTISAHPILAKRFERAYILLHNIHSAAIDLVHLYRNEQKRSDVRDATNWVEKLALYIAQSLWTYKDILPNQSPLHTITYFKNLAQYAVSAFGMYMFNPNENRYLQDNNSRDPYFKNSANVDNQYLKRLELGYLPAFKKIATADFKGENLTGAFNQIDEALQTFYTCLMWLSKSFIESKPVPIIPPPPTFDVERVVKY